MARYMMLVFAVLSVAPFFVAGKSARTNSQIIGLPTAVAKFFVQPESCMHAALQVSLLATLVPAANPAVVYLLGSCLPSRTA